MYPYGVDNSADIPLHTSDGCLVVCSNFHIEPLGNINKQAGVLDNTTNTIKRVAESHIGVVDA